MGVPIWYHYTCVDEFRHPFVRWSMDLHAAMLIGFGDGFALDHLAPLLALPCLRLRHLIAMYLILLQVPPQYPPEVREVLLRSRNTSLAYDYSQPDYEDLKSRRSRQGPGPGEGILWTGALEEVHAERGMCMLC